MVAILSNLAAKVWPMIKTLSLLVIKAEDYVKRLDKVLTIEARVEELEKKVAAFESSIETK